MIIDWTFAGIDQRSPPVHRRAGLPVYSRFEIQIAEKLSIIEQG
jgi:hypothetical protein